MSEIIYSVDGAADVTATQDDSFDLKSLDFQAAITSESVNTGGGAFKFESMTIAEYEALTTYDDETLYFLTA